MKRGCVVGMVILLAVGCHGLYGYDPQSADGARVDGSLLPDAAGDADQSTGPSDDSRSADGAVDAAPDALVDAAADILPSPDLLVDAAPEAPPDFGAPADTGGPCSTSLEWAQAICDLVGQRCLIKCGSLGYVSCVWQGTVTSCICAIGKISSEPKFFPTFDCMFCSQTLDSCLKQIPPPP